MIHDLFGLSSERGRRHSAGLAVRALGSRVEISPNPGKLARDRARGRPRDAVLRRRARRGFGGFRRRASVCISFTSTRRTRRRPTTSQRRDSTAWPTGARVVPSRTSDRWRGPDGVGAYLEMLAPRLDAAARLLRDDGTIWVHLDWRAAYLVRVRARRNLRSRRLHQRDRLAARAEPRATSRERAVRSHARHDPRLRQGRTRRSRRRRGSSRSTRARCASTTKAGRSPRRRAATTRTRRSRSSSAKGACTARERARLHQVLPREEGRRALPRAARRRALDRRRRRCVTRRRAERTGYPTQKPLALLDRIVRCATPEGGLVVDLFSGSGTTALAAAMRRATRDRRATRARSRSRPRARDLLREGVAPTIDGARRRSPARERRARRSIDWHEDGVRVILLEPSMPLAWAIDGTGGRRHRSARRGTPSARSGTAPAELPTFVDVRERRRVPSAFARGATTARCTKPRSM